MSLFSNPHLSTTQKDAYAQCHFSETDFIDVADFLAEYLHPTPQLNWPLLNELTGCSVWVKHENHTMVGAFKVRGSLVYLHWLKSYFPEVKTIITPTRGNHGQGLALAAKKMGFQAIVCVPLGNCTDKNKAITAYGAQLIQTGEDLFETTVYAQEQAQQKGYHFIPSFSWPLVLGVGSYSIEFLKARPNLHTVYVPIGLGSGICGMIAAKHALKHPVNIVGVVAENAPSYALSFSAKTVVKTGPVSTLADGVACRNPNPEALALILNGVDRILTISEDHIAEAVRLYFEKTHNIAEGAGALPLAALLQETSLYRAQDEVGLILSGGNIHVDLYQRVLSSGVG
jgi:threonine dehydratase